MAVEKTEKAFDVQEMINELVDNGQQALHEYMELNQEQTDEIVKAMALAGQSAHMLLAKMAVEETGRGIYEDKMTKNIFATEYIYHSIKNEKTVGVISENDYEGYEMIAEPVGVICGVTPVTNPTSTVMFKSIIALKARNPIIFGFHPNGQKCCEAAATIIRDAAIKAGAPKNCIQWISHPSIEATSALMNHKGIALILATGGPSMVKSAYSAGKPALGVGAGNVPCYINKNVNVKRAATDLMLSKSFDNGMICASEQAAIVDKEIAKEFEDFTKANGCYYVNEAETKKLEAVMYDAEKIMIKPNIVGQSAVKIAELAGIKVPADTRILMVPLKGVGLDYPLSHEKLSPVLAYYVVKDSEEGIQRSEEIIEFGGLGHSAAIHCDDDEIVQMFAKRLKAGRLLVNSPSTHGAIGDIYNSNMPSLTLGCGSYGNNSTTSNVSTANLFNVKRVAKRRVNMQWFKIPERIYIEAESTQYLSKMPNIKKAFIVTDPSMVKLGYVDKVLYYLRKREDYVHCEIFSDVEPDPSLATIMRGKAAMDAFQPDVIIALGGGSA
ncbi:MAG: aldehyde dehydrogenase family protein, partial [Oscillospiraceae bacterium]